MGHINTDIPELKGYDTGTVLGNLERLCRRTDAEVEAVAAHLYELAEAIRHDVADDPETVDTVLRALTADETATVFEEAARRTDVERLTVHMGLCERLTLYRAIMELRRRASFPTRKREKRAIPPVTAMAKGRIAYMPNAFADQAYTVLAGHTSARRGGTPCRAAHCHSFAEACDEVVRGQCEYCILPVENSADGKLVGFARLMARHRLFITAVCDVENHTLTEKNVTRFALLSQAPTGGDAQLIKLTEHPYLEVLHTAASSVPLADLMVAAEFCGLTLRRVDTLPMTDGSLPICVVWDTRGSDEVGLPVFLSYLLLEASDDIIMGLYDKV